ncbi:hypothetical protein A2837_03515 [Candidatus Kaiserbacteria bacterium RIFCSPHIGHO2_01_FULL_46_22]|uniref:Uncharacterized protein n=1 Tax=Candidatus Kaiserbacteria bacterium RIFCSPHIGHO2_01_FULL_46_22 TaxID=1798475 RepID=A0A1F6BXQ7_9BACT|nr:MAG: hypothetical protein A2837_03515 [Candidatus Kaiserbacteria bacterium RIFCSPHIGHO2_01_FULL_46_22]
MANIKHKVMRRVYYIYTLRRLKHPLFVHSAVVAVCFVALSRVVSIPDVFSNMLEVRVGELASFWIGAFANTGMLPLVLIGVIMFTALSLPWRWKSHELDELTFRLN